MVSGVPSCLAGGVQPPAPSSPSASAAAPASAGSTAVLRADSASFSAEALARLAAESGA